VWKTSAGDSTADDELLARFVVLFRVEDLGEYGEPVDSPQRVDTPQEVLEELRAALPGRLPPLYERLLLSYRWPEAEVDGRLRLLPNPIDSGPSGLLAAMQGDQVLWAELIPRGMVQFGKGPGICYDPVCFDLRRRAKNGDCPVLQLDHEALLCYSRIEIVAELAPSFRALVERGPSG
jgi:hypothetical protein